VSAADPSLPAAVIEDWVIEQVRRHAGAEEEPADWIRRRVERIDYDGRSGKVSIRLLAAQEQQVGDVSRGHEP